jgi:hypothetical protein
MKLFLFLVCTLICLPLLCPAQTVGLDTLRYHQVVPVPGLSADELYGRAREWVALTFEDVHQVLQLEDAARHVLLGSGYTRVQTRRATGEVNQTDQLWFRFRIESREGRYRVELFDLGSARSYLDYSTYSLSDLGRWIESGQAVQDLSGRHNALSRGILGYYSPTPKQAVQIRAGLEEAVQALLASLRQTETAPSATW